MCVAVCRSSRMHDVPCGGRYSMIVYESKARADQSKSPSSVVRWIFVERTCPRHGESRGLLVAVPFAPRADGVLVREIGTARVLMRCGVGAGSAEYRPTVRHRVWIAVRKLATCAIATHPSIRAFRNASSALGRESRPRNRARLCRCIALDSVQQGVR